MTTALTACGQTAAEPAPTAEPLIATFTPDPNQPQPDSTTAPPPEAEEPTEDPGPQPIPIDNAPDTFGTSAVDALTGEYVSCTDTEPHPVGQEIAETYDAPYEEVMKLFCNGDTFDDILIAYQTRDLSDQPVAELLDMKARAGDWDTVWADLGIFE